MNAFRENPLFLFVDDLADGTANFAAEGKIVEISDTGCDARTPGAALKTTEKPDAVIQSRGSSQNNIPNVRKPFGISSRREKSSPVKKNPSYSGHGNKIQNINGTSCKSSKESKLMSWNPKARDKVVTDDGNEVKSGLRHVEVAQNGIRGSECLQEQVKVSPVQQKTKLNATRTLTSSTYSEKYRAVKSHVIGSSIPCKLPEAVSTIQNTLQGPKTSLSKYVTNPSKISPTKVTSEASLNHYGVKKYMNRAVDKDSLSNCSRQLEMTRNSVGRSYSKTSNLSRLPKTVGSSKASNGKLKSESHVPVRTGKEATSKTTMMKKKVVGSTDRELRDNHLCSKATKTTPGKWRDRLEGDITSKVTIDASEILISRSKPGDGVDAKLSIEIRDLDHQNTTTFSQSRSKITASKVPLPRFGRNSRIGDKIVKKSENLDRVSKASEQVSDSQNSKSNEKLPSKVEKTDVARFRDTDKNLLASKGLVTDTEKVSARPSTKSHNLIPCESSAEKTAISLRTKISKPRTSSIVPKLMNEFRLQEKKHAEVPRCSPNRRQAVPSLSPKEVCTLKVESEKMKTELNEQPLSNSGILSDQLNERLSRLSDQVQDELGSKVPLLSGVTDYSGIGHRSVDRLEQSKPKVEVESCLSGVKAVEEYDEEIELKTIFEDGSATADPKMRRESSATIFGAIKSAESKFRQREHCLSSNGSKVPCPVIKKRTLRRGIVQHSPTRACPKKQASTILRGASKNSVKMKVKTEAEPSTPGTKKSVEHVPESENVKTSFVIDHEEAEEDENMIPIMSPYNLYNVCSLATDYHKQRKLNRNLENSVPQDMSHERKLESWIDGHEHAYLKGRAIGLKVMNMARAAKKKLKREFIRSGLKNATPISMHDRSLEIVDIGVSLIEKVLAEKENKIRHLPSVRGDQAMNYHDFDNDYEWNNGQWLM